MRGSEPNCENYWHMKCRRRFSCTLTLKVPIVVVRQREVLPRARVQEAHEGNLRGELRLGLRRHAILDELLQLRLVAQRLYELEEV